MIALRTLIVAVVIALVAGFSAGFLLSDNERNGATSDGNPSPLRSDSVNDSPEKVRPLGDRPPEDLRDLPAGTRPIPTLPDLGPNRADQPKGAKAHVESLLERVRAVLEGLPSEPAPKGTGEIAGTIIEAETGSPVVGVLVEAWAKDAERSQDVLHLKIDRDAQPDSVQTVLDKAVVSFERSLESTMRSHSRYVSTTTDASGKYTLSGLLDAEYMVRPRSSLYSFVVDKGEVESYGSWAHVTPGGLANYRAARQWIVAVSVTMPDGSIGRGVAVAADLAATGSSSLYTSSAMPRTTSSTGEPVEFALTKGDYRFLAKPGAQTGFVVSESVTATVGEGGVEHVTIRLFDVPGIEVTPVKSIDDGLIERLHLYCLRTSEMTPPTITELKRGQHDPSVVREGYWYEENPWPVRFEAIEPGQYLLVAVMEDQIVAHKSFVVDKGPLKVNFEFPARPRESYVVVRALDPEGYAIKDKVMFEGALSAPGSFALETSYSDWKRRKDGSTWAKHLAIKNLSRYRDEPKRDEFKWVVSAEHPDYGTVSAEYVPGPESEVVLKFTATARIEFFIEGLSGHAAAESIVAAVKLPGDYRPSIRSERPEKSAASATGPDLVIDNVQPGDVHCGILISTGSGSSIPLVGRAIRLQSGVNTVRFSLPALYPITVRVSAAGAEGMVIIETKAMIPGIDGEEIHTSETNSQRPLSRTGEAQFPFLPAGTYVARYYDTKNQLTYRGEFTLPGPAMVEIASR